MKKEYNSMAFTPEELEAGLLQNLLNYLFTYNKKSEKHYCDIHITTDSYCTIVEWDVVPYSHEWGGEFKHVDFDEDVIHYVELPDGSCVQSKSEEEDREIIEDYMRNNSDYKYDWVYQTWKHND